MNIEIMEALGLGQMTKDFREGRCPLCSKPIEENSFKDELSRKEYRISGMCQACQDNFFGQVEE